MELLQVRLGVSETIFQVRLSQINDLESLRLLVRRAATVESVEQFEQALTVLQTAES